MKIPDPRKINKHPQKPVGLRVINLQSQELNKLKRFKVSCIAANVNKANREMSEITSEHCGTKPIRIKRSVRLLRGKFNQTRHCCINCQCTFNRDSDHSDGYEEMGKTLLESEVLR